MNQFKVTPIVFSVHRKEENPIFGEEAIHVSIEDDGGGKYIKLTSLANTAAPGSIDLDIEQLEKIYEIIKNNS